MAQGTPQKRLSVLPPPAHLPLRTSTVREGRGLDNTFIFELMYSILAMHAALFAAWFRAGGSLRLVEIPTDQIRRTWAECEGDLLTDLAVCSE